MSTRNTILAAFRAAVETVSGATAQYGIIKPDKIDQRHKVEVWWHSDFGSHIESKQERTIRVVTALKFTVIPSKRDQQLIEASAVYDAIHAAIENAYLNRKTAATPFAALGHFKIVQEDPGITSDGWEDDDGRIRIGEVWHVTYRRNQGAV